MALGRKNGKITITSIKDGSTLETIDNYSKSIPELSYSPDGQFLAASDEDGTIRIWDVNTLKLIKSYKGSNGVFSPDGSFFAYMTEDNLFIINVEKFAQRVIFNQKDHAGLGAFPGPWDGRGCLIINPDGSLIATGHRNGKVALWNTLDGTLVKVLEGGDNEFERITGMDWSNDGTTIVTVSEPDTFTVWGLK